MDTPNQPQPAGKSHAIYWVILVVVILAIAAGLYVVLRTTDSATNSNSVANANTVLNINGALNTNSGTNSNSAVNTNTTTNSNTNSNSQNQNTNNSVSNASTASLNTYSDSKYHFSIKYPNTWTYHLYTTGYNNEGPYVIAFTTDRSQSDPLPFLSVKEGWSADKEIAAIDESDPPYTKVTKTEDITIGTIAAKRLTYSSSIGLTFEKIVITDGSISYIFNSKLNDAEFLSVVSSFVLEN